MVASMHHIDLQNLLNFMYQGEADVAEEGLPSFLKIEEDLKVRGLPEINTNGYKSIEKNIPQVGNINKNTPDKRKIINNESAENINDSVGHNFLKNDINTVKLFAPKTEKNNKVHAGNRKQNAIYILAVQDAAGSYPCDKCNYKTKYKSNLAKHIKAIHEGERNPCSQCDYKGIDSSSLMVHMKTVHEGVLYQCDQCQYKAKYKSDLMVQIKIVHEGVRYQCDRCHQKAKYKSDLMVHIKTVHEGVRYQCDQCPYKAKYKSDLMVHIKTVHDEVRYPCDQCHYRAKLKSDLTKHFKSIHKQ